MTKKDDADETSPETLYYAMAKSDLDVASDSGTLYRWNQTFWEAMSHDVEEATAFRWLTTVYPHKATPRIAQSCVVAATIGARQLPTRQSQTDLVVPLRNGYLRIDLTTGDLQLCEPEKADGVTYQLSARFDPTAQAPLFLKFLGDILDKDAPTTSWLQEYVGYTLTGDCRYQTALFCVGQGANGKTTLAKIIAALHRKVISLQLNALDGFRLAQLVDASLVWVDETPQRINEQAFKSLVSGGLTLVDRKHRDPISFCPRAKWLILGNALPAISDQSHGFWRRMPVIPFTRQFTRHEQDPALDSKIIERELAGVLNWAIAGLIRLVRRGQFPEPTTAMKAAQAEGQLESNSVMAWWGDDRVAVNINFETSRQAVYQDYREWCGDNGMSPLGAERFWSRLRPLAGEKAVEPKKRKIDGKTVRMVSLRLTCAKSAKIVSGGWGR